MLKHDYSLVKRGKLLNIEEEVKLKYRPRSITLIPIPTRGSILSTCALTHPPLAHMFRPAACNDAPSLLAEHLQHFNSVKPCPCIDSLMWFVFVERLRPSGPVIEGGCLALIYTEEVESLCLLVCQTPPPPAC